jgi:NADPH:quinone reductase-like Zn-dependent oxidoreductase
MDMKAVYVTGTKAAPKITLNTSVPRPVPKGDEILIKVHAGGITADELTWPELWEDHLLPIPGHDVSGVVHSLGPDYKGSLSVGDAVMAMINAKRGMGQAEYAIVTADEAAIKPATISHAQASALPIPFLTAWEAIFQHAKLTKNMKILVTGASGAVGIMLVQLAHQIVGAEIIALASSRHHDTLKALGASQVLDYNTPDWEDSVSGVDVVIDTVGNPVLAKTWKTVKSDGFIITVGDPPSAWEYGKGKPEELSSHPDVKWLFFIVTPRADILAKTAELLDSGRLKPLPIEVYPVDEAVEAWVFGAQRGRQGKVVIEFV